MVLPPSSGNFHYCRECSTDPAEPQAEAPLSNNNLYGCHCLCLVPSVKPEVESVFKEKIAQGGGWIGGRMETGRCRRLLFFLSFQKQACSSSQGGARVEPSDPQLDVDEVSDRNNRGQEVND